MENEEKNIQEDIANLPNENLEETLFESKEEIVQEEEIQTEIQEEITEKKEENTIEIPQESEQDTFLSKEEKIEESINEAIISEKENKETSKQETNTFVTTAEEDEEYNNQPEELITVRPIKFQQFEQTPPVRAIKKNLDIMQDVSMHISVELGRTKSTIREVMEMEEGSVVELDKIAGEQVEIYVNEKLVAKGEVIVIEDKFGVRVTNTNIQKQI